MGDETRPQEEKTTTSPRSDEIQLEPWYRDGNDDIVEPDRVTLQTQYFWKHWVRILGVGPAALLIRLRMYCYNNRQTGERRDACYPGQKTLGRELGVHRETIMGWIRQLQTFDFIRRKPRARWSPEHGHLVRTTDLFQVKMWDPVVPEHTGGAFVADLRRTSSDAVMVEENQRNPEKSENPTFHARAVDNPSEKSKSSTFQAVEKTDSGRSTLKEYNERNVAYQRTAEGATRPGLSGMESVPSLMASRFKRRLSVPRKTLADVLPEISVSPEKRDELVRVEDLSKEMLRQLGDSHSRPFYRLVARRFLAAGLDRLVYQALSEVKEGEEGGLLRKQPAVFTARIMQLATAHGIDLRAQS